MPSDMRAIAVDASRAVAVVAKRPEAGGEALLLEPRVECVPGAAAYLLAVPPAAAVNVVDAEELSARLAAAGAGLAVDGECFVADSAYVVAGVLADALLVLGAPRLLDDVDAGLAVRLPPVFRAGMPVKLAGAFALFASDALLHTCIMP